MKWVDEEWLKGNLWTWWTRHADQNVFISQLRQSYLLILERESERPRIASISFTVPPDPWRDERLMLYTASGLCDPVDLSEDFWGRTRGSMNFSIRDRVFVAFVFRLARENKW